MELQQDSPYSPYMNARFGFRVFVPTDWHIQEADNSDGITAREPSGSGVELRAYAHFAVVDTTFSEWVLNALLRERNKSGFVLLAQSAEDVTTEDRAGTKHVISGEKVTYAWEAASGRHQTSWLFAQYGNTQFSVQFTAPAQLFQEYLPVFERFEASLTLLPHAS